MDFKQLCLYICMSVFNSHMSWHIHPMALDLNKQNKQNTHKQMNKTTLKRWEKCNLSIRGWRRNPATTYGEYKETLIPGETVLPISTTRWCHNTMVIN